MTALQLKKEVEKQIIRGYGDKEIFVEGRQEKYHIDSIQKNTHPDIEPDYLFIMAGKLKDKHND